MTKKITKIEAQKRQGRYNIYLDGKFAFGVAENVLIRFQLARGLEIDEQTEQQLIDADDVAKAYSRALDYLSHQLRAESEVIQKLKELEIPADKIPTVMGMLREQHLLDDQNYADSFVRTMMLTSDKGPTVIRQKLRAKKIGENLIDAALEKYDQDRMVENATKLAEKQLKHYHKVPLKMRLQKVRQSLMTKGFKSDLITQVLDGLEIQDDPDEEWEQLNLQASKIWQRNRRFDYRERVMKTKRSLVGKGFSFDEIQRWMDENEEIRRL